MQVPPLEADVNVPSQARAGAPAAAAEEQSQSAVSEVSEGSLAHELSASSAEPHSDPDYSDDPDHVDLCSSSSEEPSVFSLCSDTSEESAEWDSEDSD